MSPFHFDERYYETQPGHDFRARLQAHISSRPWNRFSLQFLKDQSLDDQIGHSTIALQEED